MAASDQLYAEIAFVAYHFHWSLDEVLALEHRERRRFCEHISRINKTMSADEARRSLDLEG
ncbi:DUF6760 family protein [Dyella tabacisoli]|uniref:DUF6760 domain-containing protein n=1 Tax=Dyella tabacisoli TaxID=2282381 RepID=A0A369UKQ7_9GAMM|nr:DUF6760 family protein [Dyella tabacisoli]RDD81344.1 hypothetical protein DVJ77_13740 [Dyella tabacisoli]